MKFFVKAAKIIIAAFWIVFTSTVAAKAGVEVAAEVRVGQSVVNGAQITVTQRYKGGAVGSPACKAIATTAWANARAATGRAGTNVFLQTTHSLYIENNTSETQTYMVVYLLSAPGNENRSQMSQPFFDGGGKCASAVADLSVPSALFERAGDYVLTATTSIAGESSARDADTAPIRITSNIMG
jgi:hypothetical protein